LLLQVNDLKADYARQLSAAEARVADIEAARAAAEQQAQALQQQLDSNKALTEQVGLMAMLRIMKYASACIINCHLIACRRLECGWHSQQRLSAVGLDGRVVLSRCSSMNSKLLTSQYWLARQHCLLSTRPVLLRLKPLAISSCPPHHSPHVLVSLLLPAARHSCPLPIFLQSTSSSQAELARLQDTQKDMVSKLASAERELVQLRASSRTAGEHSVQMVLWGSPAAVNHGLGRAWNQHTGAAAAAARLMIQSVACCI
jgi:hypothetical protein